MTTKNAGHLYADFFTGEGKARISTEFASQSALFRADVLRDWIYDLEIIYDAALNEMAREFARAQRIKDADNETGET